MLLLDLNYTGRINWFAKKSHHCRLFPQSQIAAQMPAHTEFACFGFNFSSRFVAETAGNKTFNKFYFRGNVQIMLKTPYFFGVLGHF